MTRLTYFLAGSVTTSVAIYLIARMALKRAGEEGCPRKLT